MAHFGARHFSPKELGGGAGYKIVQGVSVTAIEEEPPSVSAVEETLAVTALNDTGDVQALQNTPAIEADE